MYSNLKTIDTLNIPFNGKMLECIETDVDSNGFNEIYCISNLGDLVAFSSYNDISYGEIYIAQKPNYFYENFNGLNYWEAKDKKLYLSFSNGVENQMNVVRYSLKAGETSFQLLAE